MKVFVLIFVAIIGFALSMPIEDEPDSDFDAFEDAADSKIEAGEIPVESQDEFVESRDLETAVPEDVEFPEFEDNHGEWADEIEYNQNDSEGNAREEEDESEDTIDTTSQVTEDTDDTPAAAEDDSMETAVYADMTPAADAVKDTAEDEAGSFEMEFPESEYESQDENNESKVKQNRPDENGKDYVEYDSTDQEDRSLDIPEIAAEEKTSEADETTEAADEESYVTDDVSDFIE